jgi:hypothetical protein
LIEGSRLTRKQRARSSEVHLVLEAWMCEVEPGREYSGGGSAWAIV